MATTSNSNQAGEVPNEPGLNPSDFETRLQIEQSDPNSPLYSTNDFSALGLSPELLKGVYSMGYNKPSKIQETALPIILGSNGSKSTHLIAQAQSGTGKTAAFTLGMLSRTDPNINAPQAICLCPTRELARQNYDVVSKMGQFSKHKILKAIPEEPLPPGPITAQIIIGTPGKLYELVTVKRVLDISQISIFVLDEADVMIDTQGLGEQSLRIKTKLPANCQILLFSATFSDRVAEFATKVVPRPVTTIRLRREELSLEKIKQYFVDCKTENNKFEVLSEIYGFINVGQSIIFVDTIKTAQMLHKKMVDAGHTVSILHGGKEMSAEQRDQVIDAFRNGSIRVLISTNVLARGIDILQVSLVINYDMPVDVNRNSDPETYLHRIGRSGRFGRSGIAVNLIADEHSRKVLDQIGRYLKRPAEELQIQQIDQLPQMLKDLNK